MQEQRSSAERVESFQLVVQLVQFCSGLLSYSESAAPPEAEPRRPREAQVAGRDQESVPELPERVLEDQREFEDEGDRRGEAGGRSLEEIDRSATGLVRERVTK